MNVLQYIQGIRDFSLDRPSAVTLGKFDGVHMGHQKLIEMIQEKAKQENKKREKNYNPFNEPQKDLLAEFEKIKKTRRKRKR